MVDGAGGPPHVLLPGIASGFPAAPGLLLTPKGTPNLRAVGGHVHIDDAAVRSVGAKPAEDVPGVLGEHRAAETLLDGVVQPDPLLKGADLHDVEDGGKGFPLDHGGLGIDGDDGGLDKVALLGRTSPPKMTLPPWSLASWMAWV